RSCRLAVAPRAQLKTDPFWLLVERWLKVQKTLIYGAQYLNVQCAVIHPLPDSMILKQGKTLHSREEQVIVQMSALQVFHGNRAEEITIEWWYSKRVRVPILKNREGLLESNPKI